MKKVAVLSTKLLCFPVSFQNKRATRVVDERRRRCGSEVSDALRRLAVTDPLYRNVNDPWGRFPGEIPDYSTIRWNKHYISQLR